MALPKGWETTKNIGELIQLDNVSFEYRYDKSWENSTNSHTNIVKLYTFDFNCCDAGALFQSQLV